MNQNKDLTAMENCKICHAPVCMCQWRERYETITGSKNPSHLLEVFIDSERELVFKESRQQLKENLLAKIKEQKSKGYEPETILQSIEAYLVVSTHIKDL